MNAASALRRLGPFLIYARSAGSGGLRFTILPIVLPKAPAATNCVLASIDPVDPLFVVEGSDDP